MAIEGRVAAILNERELIINRGSDAGVKEGMKFKIMEPELTVKDPDTGDPLGTFSREKIRVKIAEVQPKYSVGRTYETYSVNLGGEGVAWDVDRLFRTLAPRKEVTRVRTLRSDDSLGPGPIDEKSSFVNIGDQVVEVDDDL